MKKKTNEKGFTLVELIVVLVILAILAAILVPALLGYIDRAKKQQIVLNAKSALTASQAEMSSLYGQSELPTVITSTSSAAKRIIETADVPNCTKLTIGTTASTSSDDVAKKHASYVITYVEYEEGDQKIYFNGKAWVDDKPTAPTGGSYNVK